MTSQAGATTKDCPQCNTKLRKVLINEDSGMWLCSSMECSYPFDQPLDESRVEISKEEIKKDIETRMNKAQVNKNVISLIKTL